MSKIGNNPITILPGVTVEEGSKTNQYGGKTVIVVGPKGQLAIDMRQGISFSIVDGKVQMTRDNDTSSLKAFHGLYRSLINNAVIGVVNGYEKSLEIQGIGYRAELVNDELIMKLGFSHPIKVKAPAGITFELKDGVNIKITGIDKGVVGKITADIRAKRKPEPYKGKGIRYAGEQVKRKSGKASTK